MRTVTPAKECGQNPKVKNIDLYENRTTEGGESKVKSFCKAYLRTEPPKVVSIKLVKLT